MDSEERCVISEGRYWSNGIECGKCRWETVFLEPSRLFGMAIQNLVFPICSPVCSQNSFDALSFLQSNCRVWASRGGDGI